MSKHTPGPWHVNERYPFWVDDLGGRRLVDLESVRGVEESKANARMIAAAPDLLAACERIIQEAQRDCIDESEWSEGERMARDAIARARSQ